ncbi:MAG: hypothetical protein VYA60_04615 [Pseudomonadota bacterium]|nr:hypothetical protein [Pseudomonadota bacterium]
MKKENYKANIGLNFVLALISVLYIADAAFVLKKGYDWYEAIAMIIIVIALISFIKMIMNDLKRMKSLKES